MAGGITETRKELISATSLDQRNYISLYLHTSVSFTTHQKAPFCNRLGHYKVLQQENSENK